MRDLILQLSKSSIYSTKPREMCRVVGKVVLEMRDLGQEPKHIVIAGVLRTALANKRIQRSELEKQAMETVINALVK
ncbi:fumarate hydratase FumD [Escherichia coli]|nr:fumarate hydratase FumD [Escherichia coli]